jgi:phosphoribosylcarboxyaminoimidazole (NCAIR) mutase
MKAVRVVQGSESDWEKTNKLLEVFWFMGMVYSVSTASCHRHTLEYPAFVKGIKEDIVVPIGGHSFAAPGVLKGFLIGLERVDRIVVAIPLDVAARSAIEDLPPGPALLTPGLNTIDVNASIINGALAVAQLVGMSIGGKPVRQKLVEWYKMNRQKRPLIPEMPLVNGLIPKPEKK